MSTIAAAIPSEDLVAPGTNAATPAGAPETTNLAPASAKDARQDSLASTRLAGSEQRPLDIDRRAEVPRTERLPDPAEHIFEALSDSMRAEAINLKALYEGLPANKRRCPECNAVELRRSRAHGTIERLARTVNLYPFRCLACYHRFLAPGRS